MRTARAAVLVLLIAEILSMTNLGAGAEVCELVRVGRAVGPYVPMLALEIDATAFLASETRTEVIVAVKSDSRLTTQ